MKSLPASIAWTGMRDFGHGFSQLQQEDGLWATGLPVAASRNNLLEP